MTDMCIFQFLWKFKKVQCPHAFTEVTETSSCLEMFWSFKAIVRQNISTVQGTVFTDRWKPPQDFQIRFLPTPTVHYGTHYIIILYTHLIK